MDLSGVHRNLYQAGGLVARQSAIVICGAGIAGISAAYQLAVRDGVRNIALVDEREPLTLTSDKGTQGYRNWWPGPDDTMLRFISHSIDLVEKIAYDSGNIFRLNRRGYLFVTNDEARVETMRANAHAVSAFGMGPVREGFSGYRAAPAEGFCDQPDGADLLLGDDARRAYPFLAENTRAALHVRRAGYMNAVGLGAWLLKRAVAAGVNVVRDRVIAIDAPGARVQRVRLASGVVIETQRVVLAAGPALPDAARMLGLELPVFHELHAKVTFHDPLRVIPRSAPFTIWIDPITFSGDDVARLRHLQRDFPGGVHVRPMDGPRGDELYLIWTYHTTPEQYVWPPTHDPHYGDICVRGLAAMVPAMSTYLRHNDRGFTDGGYYCKTSDNRPLIGPLPIEGAYVLGALSGTGIMSSQASAALLADHVTARRLPSYANAFLPSRYDDPAYRETVERWGALTGQL
jgi:glycine/D-amino acid oxidase-like deaminating enzyme